MPRWRLALLVFVSVLAVAWTALWIPSFVDGLTADCAEGASEISDPCALGQFTWLAGTAAVWAVGFAAFAAIGIALRRGRRQ